MNAKSYAYQRHGARQRKESEVLAEIKSIRAEMILLRKLIAKAIQPSPFDYEVNPVFRKQSVNRLSYELHFAEPAGAARPIQPCF